MDQISYALQRALDAKTQVRQKTTGRWQTSTDGLHKSGLRDKPPAIIPKEMPSRTLSRLTEDEKSQVLAALDAYGHTDRTDWLKFKNKLPTALATKWDEVTLECRRNGFLAPYAYWNKNKLAFGWWQVMEKDGANIKMDECSMCDRGNCGTDEKGNFKACWQT